jgi:hypothetical protein
VAEQPRFDPIRILQALDRHRVNYVVVGALARVIQGAEEVTDGLDITPSMHPENLRRLEQALVDLNATTPDGKPSSLTDDTSLVEFATERGELKLVPRPAGTRGYDDLRRAASREPLGSGVRPSVASLGDLARMLAASDREGDLARLHSLRRLAELDRVR